MKKFIYLLLPVVLVYANEDLGEITVNSVFQTQVVKDVSREEIKSADLAEALFKTSPSVSLIRRSSVANDIRVRGQKKDNINVTIDGAKVCGACPNRMDPPISHVLTNNVEYIEINEGPFNVEDFGVLSADIKVHTLKPKQKFKGELNLGVGSFGFKKTSLQLSGGTNSIRVLLSTSIEDTDAYKDGNGDDFVGQIQREIDLNHAPAKVQYQPKYQKMNSYKKKTLMTKLFWDISSNQTLNFSYTANRSDNILYPSTKMDALYDDSNIYNMGYELRNINRYSKSLKFQIYQSDVEHPMSTKYRNSSIIDSNSMLPGVQKAYITHLLTTKMQGAKIKNSFDVQKHTIVTGIDYSLRNWDGGYYKNDVALAKNKFHSIWDVDTQNVALFLKETISLNSLTVDVGFRYDITKIDSQNSAQQNNDYKALNGYISTNYEPNEYSKYFIGFGKSSRVPDAKELYWVGMMGNSIGTPTLDQTTNYELDVGSEQQFDNMLIKGKIFYSYLKDYIAYNASNTMVVMGNRMSKNAYENVDATLYGFELSGTYMATESFYIDYALAYQRGEKKNPLRSQTDTNLPDIAPLKGSMALNYDYDDSLNAKLEILASDSWSDFDAQNGEQKLDSYTVLNLKINKQFGKSFDLSLGVDNIFDKTYTVSNTYKDLILLPTLNNSEVMLLNEPGRYIYTNLKYSF